jgi:hypothetical protein
LLENNRPRRRHQAAGVQQSAAFYRPQRINGMMASDLILDTKLTGQEKQDLVIFLRAL